MISVYEANKIINENLPDYPTVELPLEEAYGTVLQEVIFADRDSPAFNRSLRDGVAINFAAWEKGLRVFKIEGTQAAGHPASKLKSPENCIEIMTGAVLPEGTDCVIQIEDVVVKDKMVNMADDLVVKPAQNIQPQGADHREGEKLLSRGAVILPPQLVVAASVGKTHLTVTMKPKIAIVSTGDELVDIGTPCEPYQSRKSNSFFLKTAFENTDLLEPHMFHFVDDKKEMLKGFELILNNFDIIVISGGVSKGKFDFVPQVLEDLGAVELFHTVAQKPGKPMMFSKTKEGRPIFALPGNPVSTQICAFRYVIPAVRKAVGIDHPPEQFAVLKHDFKFEPDLTCFLPVKINCNELGQLQGDPVIINSSADFMALGLSDGFIELPADEKEFSAGYKAPLYRWRNIR